MWKLANETEAENARQKLILWGIIDSDVRHLEPERTLVNVEEGFSEESKGLNAVVLFALLDVYIYVAEIWSNSPSLVFELDEAFDVLYKHYPCASRKICGHIDANKSNWFNALLKRAKFNFTGLAMRILREEKI